MVTAFEMIPENGYLLAYREGGLLFAAYRKETESILLSNGSTFADEAYFEIHLFDAEKEYRLIRENDGEKAFLFTAAEERETEEEFFYCEKQYLKPEYTADGKEHTITVVNRFGFTSDDRVYLLNYRLGAVV